jgi:protein TonB
MPRLRTTTSLSLLALAIGAVGTGWLSTRTAVWPGTSPSALAASGRTRTAGPPQTAPAPSRARHHRVAPAIARQSDPAAAANSTADQAAPTLVPVSMPAPDTRYDRLRGHLDGSVLLQVTVDGGGRVRAAAVARSSGDPVLDAHALEVVDGWRFAVPADRPDGFTGELPMRFDTGTRLTRAP